MTKVYWVGPLVKASSVGGFSAISPAGNLWQSSCIIALKESGVDISVLSYLPDSFAPKGRLFPRFSGETDLEIEVKQCKYCNIPFVRNRSLARGLRRNVEFGSSQIFVTYNSYPSHVALARHFKKHSGAKWINIVAENDASEFADATFYLSYKSFITSKLKNRYHLDGGVSLPVYNYCQSSYCQGKKILLFAGSISQWTGIVEFATSYSKLASNVRSQFELHIYGKGNSNVLRKLESLQIGVRVKGFVSKSELEESMMNCFAFVNPRPLIVQGGDTNFPSKLFEYFRFAKPVISTLTAGLSPIYRDLLLSYDSELSLSNLLRNLAGISIDEHRQIGCRIQRFAEEHSWQCVVSKLSDLIRCWSDAS